MRSRDKKEIQGMTIDTNSLTYLPKGSSKNCDLQFANTDRQTDIFKKNYSR